MGGSGSLHNGAGCDAIVMREDFEPVGAGNGDERNAGGAGLDPNVLDALLSLKVASGMRMSESDH